MTQHITTISTIHDKLEEMSRKKHDMLSKLLFDANVLPAHLQDYLPHAPVSHTLLLSLMINKGLIVQGGQMTEDEFCGTFHPVDVTELGFEDLMQVEHGKIQNKILDPNDIQTQPIQPYTRTITKTDQQIDEEVDKELSEIFASDDFTISDSLAVSDPLFVSTSCMVPAGSARSTDSS